MEWYLQSYLAGIDKIIVGKKFEEDHVYHITSYDTETLRKQGQDFWDLDDCMNFLCSFMDKVKSQLAQKPEGTVLLSNYDYYNKNEHVDFYDIAPGSQEAKFFDFLPDKFKKLFV
uniref:Decapping nuclease n=1 Tax=Acrobeloides nanus TaxID=290746 RepID=A0A914CVD4_9BILA